MKVLVTGADKFLGSHLVDRLVAEDYDVVALDPDGGRNFITNKARVYRQDYRARNHLEKLFARERPQMVFHFHALGTIVTSFEAPRETTAHIHHTLVLLDLCKRYNVKRVVYPSSAAVYGNPQYLPCDEQHPTHPVSPLGVVQTSLEKYLYYYWVNFGTDHVILRTANVFGPRQGSGRGGGIMSVLISRMLRRESIIINGDGMQERDFVFFSDVMDAVMAAAKLPERNSKRAAPTDFIYNVGTGYSVSVNGLLEMLKQRIPYERRPIKGPQRPCEVFEMRLHCRHAHSALEWKPGVTLDAGIDKTILWFKKKIKI